MNGHNGITGIIICLDLLILRRDFFRDGRVVFIVSLIYLQVDIFVSRIQLLDGIHLLFQSFQFLHEPLGLFRIVPEARLLYLVLQFLNPSFLPCQVKVNPSSRQEVLHMHSSAS